MEKKNYPQVYFRRVQIQIKKIKISNIIYTKLKKESMHYTCIACITIDSVMRMEKKN